MAVLRRLLALPLIAILLLTSLPAPAHLQAQAELGTSSSEVASTLQENLYLPLLQGEGAAISATITPQGGELTTPDQRVRLVMPAGAVSEPVTVSFVWNGSAPQLSGLNGLSSAFDLTAHTLQGNAVTQFAKPLQIHVQIEGTTSQTAALFYYDTTKQRWIALSSSFDAQNRVLTGMTDHFTTFVVANEDCGVGEGNNVPFEVTAAFQEAYDRNGGIDAMGDPVNCVHEWWAERGQADWVQDFPDAPSWGKTLILWNPNQKNAYALRGSILQRYMDTFGGMGDDSKNGPGSWLGSPISDAEDTPLHFNLHTGRIVYFERGFIATRKRNQEVAADSYYPSVCDVKVSVEDAGANWKLTINAQVNRRPGEPQIGNDTDPLKVNVFYGFFPGDTWGEKREGENIVRTGTNVEMTPINGSLSQFSGSFIRPKVQENPHLPGEILFAVVAENMRGIAAGWTPRRGGYPFEGPFNIFKNVALPLPSLYDGYTTKFNTCDPTNPKPGGGDSGSNQLTLPVARVSATRFTVPADYPIESINISGVSSYDPDSSQNTQNGIKDYQWEVTGIIGSGFPRNGILRVGATFAGQQLRFTPTSGDIGGWRFRLTVTDDDNQKGFVNFFITVNEPDYDGDGITDRDERTDEKLDEQLDQVDRTYGRCTAIEGRKTCFNDADTDNDGILDQEERFFATGQGYNTPIFYRDPPSQRGRIVNTEIDGSRFSLSGNHQWTGVPGAVKDQAVIGIAFSARIPGPIRDYKEGFFNNQNRSCKLNDVLISAVSQNFPYVTSATGINQGFGPRTDMKLLLETQPSCDNYDGYSIRYDLNVSWEAMPYGYDERFRSVPRQIRINSASVQRGTSNTAQPLPAGGFAVGGPAGTQLGVQSDGDGGWTVNFLWFTASLPSPKKLLTALPPQFVTSPDGRGGIGVVQWTSNFPYHLWGATAFGNPQYADKQYIEVPLNMSTLGSANNIDTVKMRIKGKISWVYIDGCIGEEPCVIQEDDINTIVYVRIQKEGYASRIQIVEDSASSNLGATAAPAGFVPVASSTSAESASLSSSFTSELPVAVLAETTAGSQNTITAATAPLTVTSETLIDSDNDGDYDQLKLSVQLPSTSVKTRILSASLRFPDSNTIERGSVVINNPTALIAELLFNSERLYTPEESSELEVVDLALLEQETETLVGYLKEYTTSKYNLALFSQPSITIGNAFSDQGIDTNGDGLYEAIRINTPVVTEHGTNALINGYLYDAKGTFVAKSTGNIAFQAGENIIPLDFVIAPSTAPNYTGPFVLQLLEVYDEHQRLELGIGSAYTTTTVVTTSQLQSPPIQLITEKFQDQGIDTDENGKYNFLAWEFAVNSRLAGRYRVQADLSDPLGEVIRFQSETRQIQNGLNTFRFLYDGPAIGKRNMSGRYRVQMLEFIDPATNITVWRFNNVYETSYYNASDFENGLATPELARNENGNLVLLMGPRASERGVAQDEKNETFVVRQLDAEGSRFSVTAFGIYDEETITPGGRVIADAGDGNDSIILEPFSSTFGGIVSFTARAFLEGGDGDDQLTSAAGLDVLNGGSGNDTIKGGAGEDTLNGGSGNDLILGETEDDTLIGGPGDDQLFGNAGDDQLFGDEQVACSDIGQDSGGNDTLHGGLGNDQLLGGAGNDTLRGDAGDDTLCGNAGDDLLDGDTETALEIIGNDILRGGNGSDKLHGRGGDDNLFGEASDDRLFGEGGDDNLSGGLGIDDLDGGEGRDYLFGDDGRAIRAPGSADAEDVAFSEDAGVGDRVQGGPGDDVIYGEGGDDDLRGGAGQDLVYGNAGNDTIDGEDGNDTLRGNAGNDTVCGGAGDDDMEGNADRDSIFGGEGRDYGRGGDGDDLLRGEDGDDLLEGNAGADNIAGGLGDDDLIGGSSASGQPDAGDQITGNEGHDVMVGDNAQITRPGGINAYDGSSVRTVTLLNIDVPDATLSGPDVIDGGDGNDRAFGQGGSDTIYGRANDDYLEGNAAVDTIYGGAGQDDIVGGSDSPGRQDGADNLWGDDGQGDTAADHDVITGDNARIVRPLDSAGKWQVNAFNGSVRRTVTLYDVGKLGQPTIPASVSGAEQIYGQGGDDLIYGQGGDDTIWSGVGDDYVEGNAGADTVDGGQGNDDLVGGTGRVNSDGPQGADGRLDSGDTLRGGAGFDVIAGDNAVLARTIVNGRWQQNTFNGGIRHELRILRDVDAAQANLVSGADTIYGDADDDLLYGQGGRDTVYGGAGDDYAEGNAAGDRIYGEGGQDDLIGGSPELGLSDGDDIVEGGADADVALGDNGSITRPLDPQGRWQRLTDYGYNIVVRDVTMASAVETATAFGDDQITGGAGPDELYGQLGDDNVFGDAGEDVLIGDLGRVATRIEDGSRQQFIRSNQPFLEETIYKAGTLTRQVELLGFAEGIGGADTLLGGDGNDSAHGGPGNDLVNGNAGTDSLFGGDGDDAIWGGPDRDYLWGGHGNDWLDVKPRPASGGRLADPKAWFDIAGLDNYQGYDYAYGGWGQDAMQGDVGGSGPQPGDRLIDWVGAYNVYYVCPAAYGEGMITRSHSPSVVAFLQQLAESGGARDAAVAGSSGFRQLGLVQNNEARFNANPPHPDQPGHFTCN